MTPTQYARRAKHLYLLAGRLDMLARDAARDLVGDVTPLLRAAQSVERVAKEYEDWAVSRDASLKYKIIS